jgi:branched-chain amino acid aminotransferase
LLCSEDGAILEGVGSNFYAVIDGELRTADQGVLPGIARGMLLEAAQTVIPVNLSPVRAVDVPRLNEAMLTSASRGVLPIVRIGDQVVGGGAPGPVCRALRTRYDAQVEQELELV